MDATDANAAPPKSGALPRTLWHPHAVILAEPGEVRLGDVLLDTLDGPLVVDELVRRRGTPVAEFAQLRISRLAGDAIARPWTAPAFVVAARRVIDHGNSLLRVARTIEAFAPQRGHNMRVHSHNPVRRGCYVLNDGWAAACSCGWPGTEPQIHHSKTQARSAWIEHKAAVITAAAYERHAGYRLVAAAEQAHPLPPIPWSFAHNGVALARLDPLGPKRALPVAQAWAAALGAPDGVQSSDRAALRVAALAPDDAPYGARRVLVSIDGFFIDQSGRA